MKQISKLLLVAVGVAFLVGCGGGSSLSKGDKTLNKGVVAVKAGKYAEAMRLYKKAIKQGESDGKSENNIGVLYAKGQSVPKDLVEALRWFRIAARKGSRDAMVSLGWFYEYGKGGVSANDAEAARWYRRAGSLASTDLARVERRIAAAERRKKEIQEAEERRLAEEKRIAEAEERKRKLDTLIARGAMDERDADSNATLHLAAKDNDINAVQRLIAANADVNIVNKRADTPLHFAVRANSREAVKALLRAGANPYKPNLKNESAMAIAVESGDEDLVGEFVLAGAEVNLLADLSTDKAQRDWEAEQERKRQEEAQRLAEEAKKRAKEQAAEAKRLAEKQRKAEAEARSQQRWADLTNHAARLAQNYAQLKTNINNTNRANAALAAAQQAAAAAARQASAAERQAAVAEQQAATATGQASVTQTTATPKSSYSSIAVERSSTWGYGWSLGNNSRLQADNEALKQCRFGTGGGVCSIVHRWEGPGCVASAAGNSDGRGAWAVASVGRLSTAEQSAVSKCGSGCTVDKGQCVGW